MSQAEELLDSLPEDNYMAGSGDEERHIVIGRDRIIAVPEELKKIAVQYDHDIETVTFDCPRYWDGHDLSGNTFVAYINYMREDGAVGTKLATNKVVDTSDDQIMHFDWTVSRNATEVKGALRFLVCIKKVDTDGNEVNHWNSEINEEMYIVEGMECDSAVITKYPDIITDLLVRVEKAESVLDMTWVNATDEEIAKIKNGDTIVKKAEADAEGNVIHETYGTKEEVAAVEDAKVNRAGDTITGDLTVEGTMKLPNSVTDLEETTVSAGYSARQTAGGLKIVDDSLTIVKKIEGKTVKTTNLIPHPYRTSSSESNGITFTCGADGSIKIVGTNDGVGYSQIILAHDIDLPLGTYFVSGENTIVWVVKADSKNVYHANGSFTLEDGDAVAQVYVQVDKGETVDKTVYPMLNKGSTALPYTPYFEGLKHASIYAIKSTGKNLIDVPDFTLVKDGNPSVDLNLSGTVTLSCRVTYSGMNGISSSAFAAIKVDGAFKYKALVGIDSGDILTMTVTGSKITKVSFLNWPEAIGSVSEVMLNYGAQALPFEPYKEDIFQLPEEVECGLGVTIDPGRRKIINSYKELIITSANHNFKRYSDTATTYICPLATQIGAGAAALHDGKAGATSMISTNPDLQLTGATADKSSYGTLVLFNTDCETMEEFVAKYLSTPLYVRYITSSVQSEEEIDILGGYEAWNGGSEAIVCEDVNNDDSQWGAVPTITQTYMPDEDPDEAATKGFVRNAMAKMVDEDLFESVMLDIKDEMDDTGNKVAGIINGDVIANSAKFNKRGDDLECVSDDADEAKRLATQNASAISNLEQDIDHIVDGTEVVAKAKYAEEAESIKCDSYSITGVYTQDTAGLYDGDEYDYVLVGGNIDKYFGKTDYIVYIPGLDGYGKITDSTVEQGFNDEYSNHVTISVTSGTSFANKMALLAGEQDMASITAFVTKPVPFAEVSFNGSGDGSIENPKTHVTKLETKTVYTETTTFNVIVDSADGYIPSVDDVFGIDGYDGYLIVEHVDSDFIETDTLYSVRLSCANGSTVTDYLTGLYGGTTYVKVDLYLTRRSNSDIAAFAFKLMRTGTKSISFANATATLPSSGTYELYVTHVRDDYKTRYSFGTHTVPGGTRSIRLPSVSEYDIIQYDDVTATTVVLETELFIKFEGLTATLYRRIHAPSMDANDFPGGLVAFAPVNNSEYWARINEQYSIYEINLSNAAFTLNYRKISD